MLRPGKRADRDQAAVLAASAVHHFLFCQLGPLELRPVAGICWAQSQKPQRQRATYTRKKGVEQLHGFYDFHADCLVGGVRKRKAARDMTACFARLRGCYPIPLRVYVIMDNLSANVRAAAEMMKECIEKAFASVDPTGKAAAECWANYRIKLEGWQAHPAEFAAFLKDWPEIRSRVERFARPPERLVEILRAIEAPLKFAELTPPATEAQVKYAFLNASLMRKRLTIGDLLIFFNWDRETLWREVWRASETVTNE